MWHEKFTSCANKVWNWILHLNSTPTKFGVELLHVVATLCVSFQCAPSFIFPLWKALVIPLSPFFFLGIDNTFISFLSFEKFQLHLSFFFSPMWSFGNNLFILFLLCITPTFCKWKHWWCRSTKLQKSTSIYSNSLSFLSHPCEVLTTSKIYDTLIIYKLFLTYVKFKLPLRSMMFWWLVGCFSPMWTFNYLYNPWHFDDLEAIYHLCEAPTTFRTYDILTTCNIDFFICEYSMTSSDSVALRVEGIKERSMSNRRE